MFTHRFRYFEEVQPEDNPLKSKGKLLPLSQSNDFDKFKVNPIKYALCSRAFHFCELGILASNDMLTYVALFRSEAKVIQWSIVILNVYL